jgi:hypothetical protein
MAKKQPAQEWVWMTHPSRNNGAPFPVLVYTDPLLRERCYQPFDFSACDFAWDQRDDKWQIVAAPAGVPTPEGSRNGPV